MSKVFEVNFDGIVGPTHNYAGLSYGNLASMTHKGRVSHPKEAALQGLKKMKLLFDLGIKQGVLPPQCRPNMQVINSFGFTTTQAAYSESPLSLFACSSASSMWAANSATFTPSSDSKDGKVHISIANLMNRFHRAIESAATYNTFKIIFPKFSIHPPFPAGGHFGDEGAANHTRFCKSQGEKGIHLFVYNCLAFDDEEKGSFPLRQSLEASQAIARRHGLLQDQVFFVRQNRDVIGEGVFHNDVISVGHESFFFCHESAYENTYAVLDQISQKIPLSTCILKESDLPVKKAIKTYLFNSQIVSLGHKRILIAPIEAQELKLNLPFDEIHYVNLRESMQNGGGPACLRLRMVLSEEELETVNPHVILTENLYNRLVEWVETHYRENLNPEDLADPLLFEESMRALNELNHVLHLE